MNQLITKRILLSAILLMANPIVFAKPLPTDTVTAFQGFYIGSSLGYAEGGAKKKFIEYGTGQIFNINDLGVRGVAGGIGVGYTHRIGNWALGLSLDEIWSNASGYHRHLDGGEAISAELNNSSQLYARGGYVFFERILPFLGLGWDNSSWTLSSVHTNPTGTINRDRLEQRQNALLWKIGMDFLVSPCLSLGFEYIGTLASSKVFFYPNELFQDTWKPQNNTYALTAKVIPFANGNVINTSQTSLIKGEKEAFQGFYVSGNIGYGNGVGTKTKFITDTLSRKGTPNPKGADGGVGVGYSHRIQAYMLGIAFDSNWSNTEATRYNVPDNKAQTIQLENSLQLYSRAGRVFFEKIMPFVGLGWDNSAWSLRLTDKGVSDVQKHRHNALLWKLGMDFILINNAILGVEYTGTAANTQKYLYGTPFINQDTGALTILSHEWTPQYNKIAVTAKILV